MILNVNSDAFTLLFSREHSENVVGRKKKENTNMDEKQGMKHLLMILSVHYKLASLQLLLDF